MARYTESPPLFSRFERFVAWLVGLALVFSLLALSLYHAIFVQILPGQVGVRYSLLFGGTKEDTVLPEGYALKLPWDRVYIYEVRLQQVPFSLDVLSLEGMSVQVEGNLLFRPKIGSIGVLQKTVGPDYAERLVLPVGLAAIREAVAQQNSQELYSVSYGELEQHIYEILDDNTASSLVDFVDIAVRMVAIPPQVSQAIETKLEQEQLAASYEFRLLSEQQEADRRRIEAIGIQNYYAIVSEALTDTVLAWRGIEATVELAQSPNTKIVIVGGDRGEMPLILGSEVPTLPQTASPIPPVAPSQAPALPDWTTAPTLFPDPGDHLSTAGTTRSAVGTTAPAAGTTAPDSTPPPPNDN